MPNAMTLAIDPHLLCLPDPCRTLEQIEAFVNALLGWSRMLQRADARILVADASRIALIQEGEYPQQYRLRQLLHQYKCDVADHETICRVTQNLLDRTPSLEDFYGVTAVLFDDRSIHVNPEHLSSRLKKGTSTALAEMLVIVSVEQTIGSGAIAGHTVIASSSEHANVTSDPDDIEFKAELHDWQWASKPMFVLPQLPVQVECKIPLALSHEALLSQLGLWDVWSNATDEQAAIDAIKLCIAEIDVSGKMSIQRPKCQIGSRFLESASNWGFGSRCDYARLLIESCARIILGIPKHPVEPFRESATSSRQRNRSDGALAYRTHLTKKGAGFRLMLWKLTDGTIEFANVGDKDELIIL